MLTHLWPTGTVGRPWAFTPKAPTTPTLEVLPRFALRLEFVVQVTIFPPGSEIEAVYAPLLGIEAAAPPLNNETHAPALGLEEIR